MSRRFESTKKVQTVMLNQRTVVLDQIAAAIREKRALRIHYAPGWRDIEPHALGRGSQGQFLLRAFQTDGATASGEDVHWKLFRVDRLSGPPVVTGAFEDPRPGFRRGDSAMAGGIIAQV